VLTITDLVTDCELFDGLSLRHLQAIAACGRLERFPGGAAILGEGRPADRFFVLREGTVALETASPGRGRLVIQTLGRGDALGWSWLFPPHRWHLDATACENVVALAFDAACVRGRCDADHELGYELMGRFADVMLRRLTFTRLLLRDVYARSGR
jgi:CRP/FNR family transcriptional regulator, cyclic AMP receptor protein